MLDKFKAVGAAIATLLTGVILIWWLVIVASKLGVKPQVVNGSVVLDEWSRARDILTVVLPLFTATLAYWVGSQNAGAAKTEAAESKAKLDAVIDSAPEGVLKTAKAAHPEAFAPSP